MRLPAREARESLSTRHTASPKSTNSPPSPRAWSSSGTGVSQRGGQPATGSAVAAFEELVEGRDTLHLGNTEPGPGGRVEAEHRQGLVEAFAHGGEGLGVLRVGGGAVAAAGDSEVVGDAAGLDGGGGVGLRRNPGEAFGPDLAPQFGAVLADLGGEVRDAVGLAERDDGGDVGELAAAGVGAGGPAGSALLLDGDRGPTTLSHRPHLTLSSRHSR